MLNTLFRKEQAMRFETYDDLDLVWASDDCPESAEISEEDFDRIREEIDEMATMETSNDFDGNPLTII